MWTGHLGVAASGIISGWQCLPAGAVSGREQGRLEAPAWVRASGGTSMRLVQTGRDAATCSPLGSSLPAHSPRARSEAASDAAFQHAPWMGHGGVHHMDAGHTGRVLHV